ncbi:MAG: hypothetical protein KAS90_04905 [Candidatus Aenigmarchaeota archaeon]|nr:hypothetical protein [Candidatus Aenigmarchaeota archaeon]
MNITKTQGLGAQGYSAFIIDGMKINPNGYGPKVAGVVCSLLDNMYTNNGFDELSTKEEILAVIKEGSNGYGTPSLVDVAKAFPDDIARRLLNAELTEDIERSYQ